VKDAQNESEKDASVGALSPRPVPSRRLTPVKLFSRS